MLMIAAALEDELEPAKRLCTDMKRVAAGKAKLWQARRNGERICFLKTGVGPRRSAENFTLAVRALRPSRALVIGYAGALDPGLKLGSLVAVERAIEIRLRDEAPSWDDVQVEGEFELTGFEPLVQAAQSAELNTRSGDVLTSRYVLGEPAHKRRLYERFRALIVDMETAALARAARAESVPLSCIRAVSDEAGDSFLAPFAHDPAGGFATRAKKLLDTGMVETYREWRLHSFVAKESLSRFLSRYL